MAALPPKTGGNIQKDSNSATVTPTPNRGGLEGIVAASTALSKVEGTAGRLIYHGYNIHDLARTTTFEEIAYLFWFGKLPNKMELVDLKVRLLEQRTLPAVVLEVLRALPPTTAPMGALRTAVSAWGAAAIHGQPDIEDAISLIVRFPLVR